MKTLIVQEVIRPLVHRVGSLAGTAVASFEYFSQADGELVSAVVILILGFLTDLVVRKSL